MRVGDVIKFGRVPFRVKENSAQSSKWQDSMEPIMTQVKNITDIDSSDLDRDDIMDDIQSVQYNFNNGPSLHNNNNLFGDADADAISDLENVLNDNRLASLEASVPVIANENQFEQNIVT